MPDPAPLPKRSWVDAIGGTFVNLGMTLFPRFPRLDRSLQCLSQELAPTRIRKLGSTFVVTAFEDVCEVLERDTDFVVGPLTSPKLHTGPFPLGMDASPQYQVDRGLTDTGLAVLLPPELARALAQTVLGALRLGSRGSFDAIGRYGQIVPSLFVEQVLGLPLPAGPEPARKLADWLRNLAIPIAMNHPAPFWVQPWIAASRDAFMSHLREEIGKEVKRLETGGAMRSTSLSQAVAASLTHALRLDDTCRVLAGTILTSHAVITKAFAHTLRHLLTYPEILERARQAIALEDVALGHQTLRAIILESLRFDPVFPVLGRFAPRGTLLARGTKRETFVPAGSRVIVGALGAMFDPGALDQPDVFDEQRWIVSDPRHLAKTPVDLVFSRGLHRCPGSFLALELLCGMVSELCALPKLRRAGRLGYWTGTPAVKRLRVRFG